MSIHSNMQGLTIAICTRNRPEEMLSCVRILSKQERVQKDISVEILVVDDGSLEEDIQETLRSLVPDWMNYRYHRKWQQGLFLSRIEACQNAFYDVILFIDDDTELFPDYLRCLTERYAYSPEIVAIGGVDQYIRSSWIWRLYACCFLFSSGNPGRLSITGYGGSMVLWPTAVDVFISEFLSGCNMSFRKEALSGMQPCSWMLGYSLGEDLYLSHLASRHGLVIVDPQLRVYHHQTPISRDRQDVVAETEIVNHHYLLLNKSASLLTQVLHFWTAAGLWIWSMRNWKDNEPKRRGYLRGIVRVAQEMYRNFTK